MTLTGINYLYLPQVSGFYFDLSNITLSDFNNPVTFSFIDKSSNSFSFQFLSGYVYDNSGKIISSCNLSDYQAINGYIGNNILNYQINGIFNKIPLPFNNLNILYISSSSTTVNCDVSINSNPINYSVSFPNTYNVSGQLVGIINSDTNFTVYNPNLLFYNNSFQLLTPPSSVFTINSGSNSFPLQDVDPVSVSYLNTFSLGLTSSFGDIGGKFSSNRQVYATNLLTLSDYDSNVYYQDSLFNGSWSGNSFSYSDNPLNYNLSFNTIYGDIFGDSLPSIVSIKYESLYPIDNSGYASSYVTGFNLTNSGLYSGSAPSASFTNYYYVTGLEKANESFLFSSGCSNQILTTFSGGSPSGNASGYLNLVNVYLSGIYGSGVKNYKAVTNYSALNSGSGYKFSPSIILATGGSCYSLPDYSGIELGQFKKISGSGSLLSQAGGLYGEVLTSQITGSGGVVTGYRVTGLNLTNIGYGYGSSYPPTVSFIRSTGDPLTSNASGTLSYKSTGLYNFTGFWTTTVGSSTLPIYSAGGKNYYSGNFQLGQFQNYINLGVAVSGLDNTSPVTGLLTVYLSDGFTGVSAQRLIFQSRSFNSYTGALLPNPSLISYTPPPDLSGVFQQNQLQSQTIYF